MARVSLSKHTCGAMMAKRWGFSAGGRGGEGGGGEGGGGVGGA